MQGVKGRKQFVEPELIKSKEPLGQVTFGVEIVRLVNVSGNNEEEFIKIIKEVERIVSEE